VILASWVFHLTSSVTMCCDLCLIVHDLFMCYGSYVIILDEVACSNLLLIC